MSPSFLKSHGFADAATSEAKIRVSMLIVGHQQVPCAFLHTVLSQQLRAVGSVMVPEFPLYNAGLVDAQSSLAFGFPTNFLFAVTPITDHPVLLFTSQQPLPDDRMFDFTAALFSRIQPDRVLVLSTLQQGAFWSIGGDEAVPPLLRVVQTSICSKASDEKHALKPLCPFLEPPHLVHSLPAAILSHCEIRDIPAQLYLSLSSEHSLLDAMQAFEPVASAWSLIPAEFATMSLQQRQSKYRRSVDQSRLAQQHMRSVTRSNVQSALLPLRQPERPEVSDLLYS